MKKILSILILFCSLAASAQNNSIRIDRNPWSTWGNYVTDGMFLGSINNKSLYIKTNGSNSHVCKIDSFGYMVLVPDTNGTGAPSSQAGFELRGSYQNNAYMVLSCDNISALRLKHRSTGKEWFLQNQTYGGGVCGLDGIGLGLTSNPAQSFLALTKRGSLTVQTYSNNTLGTRLIIDTLGSVGIGTTSPQYKLEVVGTVPASRVGIRAINLSTTGWASNYAFSDGASGGIFTLGSAASLGGAYQSNSSNFAVSAPGGCNIVNTSSAPMGFYVGGFGSANEAVRIFTNGNVAIQAFGATHPITSTATLQVQGTFSASSTSTLNNAVINGTVTVGNTSTLTGGNSGTIAVLSDALFPVTITAPQGSPNDATTYIFGVNGFPVWSTGNNVGRVYMPYNCTLIGYSASFFTNGTLSSGESATLSLNVDGSDVVTLSNAVTLADAAQNYTANALSTNVNAGSYVQCSLLTPTWATNPTSTSVGITLFFVRRK